MRSGRTLCYLVIFFVVIGILGIFFGPRQRELEKIRKQHDMVPVIATSDRPANEKTGGFMYLKDEPHLLYVEKVNTEWRWFRLHYTAKYIQYSETDADGNINYYAYDPDSGEIVITDIGMTALSVLNNEDSNDVKSILDSNTNRDNNPDSGRAKEVMENEEGAQNGCRVTQMCYKWGGVLDGHLIYSYDAQGRLNKVEYYDSSGSLESYGIYGYDNQGRLSRYDDYDSSGSLESYGIYVYNRQGRLNKSELYNLSGSLIACYAYSYDDQGRLSKNEAYSSNGNLLYYHAYSYDDQGRLSRYDNDDLYYNVYSYDDQGRLSKCQRALDWGLGGYYIYSYDDQGRLSKCECYDPSGSSNVELVGYYDYSYDGQSKVIPNQLAYSVGIVEDFSVFYILTR